MKSFQVKGKETEELNQLYKNLQRDWDAFNSATASRKYTAPSNATIKAIQLRDRYSPRELMSHLQQESSSPAEAWRKAMTRNEDVAAQETIRERREAIESGKLKGRRLFHPPMEVEGEGERERGFSGWRADIGPHHCEVRSLSFYYSEDEREDESSGSKGQLHCISGCSYSSSSSSSPLCLCGDASVDSGQEVERVENIVATVAERKVAIGRHGNGGRYAVFLGGVAVALLIIAICMSFARSSGGCDFEVILVPT